MHAQIVQASVQTIEKVGYVLGKMSEGTLFTQCRHNKMEDGVNGHTLELLEWNDKVSKDDGSSPQQQH